MGEFELKKNVLVAAPGSKRSSSSSSKARNSGGFTRKCACLVKEQRARIYILRRCATMLLCWYIQGDD